MLDREFEKEILERAMERVQQRVEPRTWEAFRLLALEGVSGQEAAQRLHMDRAAVYVAKNRVSKMLQEETARLETSP